MKSIHILIIALFLTASSFAQTKIKCDIKDPLPIGAFNKMIVQDITYAVVGENTPVSGLKVDITKPEATISGVFPTQSSIIDLIGLEFKGGATNGNFSIFKGTNNFNTAFELKPSFHIIPPLSSAKYGICEVAKPNTQIIDAKNKIVLKNATAVIDSFYAISLIRIHHLINVKDFTDPTITLPTEANISVSQKKVVVYFVKKIRKKEDLFINETHSLQQILGVIPKASISTANGEIDISTYYDEVGNIYNKYYKLYKNLETYKINTMISNASEIWTRKKYWWFTVSPYGRTEKVNEYYTKFDGNDSSYFKSDYRFYYGTTFYANRYIVIPNKRAHYYRLGIAFSQSNNLTTLTSYNYETRNPLYSYGSLITEKTKSGTAYNYEDIETGFLKQLSFEYYRLPLKSLIPGIYVSTNLNLSELYNLPTIIDRENDKLQTGLEGGLVFNINSREKDKEKSILSILFYMRHEDLTDKRRTSSKTGLKESLDDFRNRNLNLGIRVGIPITMPQRSN